MNVTENTLQCVQSDAGHRLRPFTLASLEDDLTTTNMVSASSLFESCSMIFQLSHGTLPLVIF